MTKDVSGVSRDPARSRARARRVPAWIAAIALVVIGLGVAGRYGLDRTALWRVVDDLCLPAHRLTGQPFPCSEVDAAAGAVVLAPPLDGHELLVVPSERILGIEDPVLRRAGARDYWSFAWAKRALLAEAVGRPLPDDGIVLAVNSRWARSQDQLHIHLDCLDARVRARLAKVAAGIGTDWTPIEISPRMADYRIRRLDARGLAEETVERRIAAELAPSEDDWNRIAVALIGTSLGGAGEPVFLLAVTTGLLGAGRAEELMDHACREPPPHGGK